MALVNPPKLDCPKGHELMRPVYHEPGRPLHAETVCPRCHPAVADVLVSLAHRWPVCAAIGCPAPAIPGERYCERCRDEMDALREFVAERQRQRERAA